MAWFGLMRESEPIYHESAALTPGRNQAIASAAILPAFLVRPFRESEPIYHESAALSPGRNQPIGFCGHSACISRPFYQGKVNHFAANLWHFPLGQN